MKPPPGRVGNPLGLLTANRRVSSNRTSKCRGASGSIQGGRFQTRVWVKVCNVLGKFDIIARCSGGGYMGQAQAIRLGVSRALRDYDPTMEDALRDAGFLTRDAREVERKKYGQAGARRRFQFSKR